MRGVAIALMIAYHFCFDLNHFGFIHTSFETHPFWLASRALIVSLFLGLTGASAALADAAGDRRPFLRRRGALLACCVLVSMSSYLMFPRSWIFFGVLHFILLASLIVPFFLRWQWPNLAAGIVLVALGVSVQLPAFDQPMLQWLGLMTFKPRTEDYVPMLPWFGVVLLGVFAARSWLAAGAPGRGWRAHGGVMRLASQAGRHSLMIYMVHQPVLIGCLYLWRQWVSR